MHRVPRNVGVVEFDFGEDGKPDEVAINAFEFRDYVANHAAQFKASHGADWAGPLVAAFLGRPYSVEEWSEGRASFVMEILFDEVAKAKKAGPASATPA